MEREYVESTNIYSVKYDSDNSILEIEFRDGYVYEYYDVPQYEYDNLMAADSKGKYAHKHIYKFYRQNRTR